MSKTVVSLLYYKDMPAIIHFFQGIILIIRTIFCFLYVRRRDYLVSVFNRKYQPNEILIKYKLTNYDS